MAGDVDTSDYLASARDKGGELMRTVHEGDQMLIADAPLIVSNVLNPKWYSQQDTQQSNKKDLPTTIFGQSSLDFLSQSRFLDILMRHRTYNW